MRPLVKLLVAGLVFISCGLPSSDRPARADAAKTARSPIVNATSATFDPTWGAPSCTTVGSGCDSVGLLAGRGSLGPELHQPNTVGGSCADGTSGTYGSNASLERLTVYRSDGTALATGKEVTVEASVQASTSFTQEALDLYAAPDASNPAWTFIATLSPTTSGLQTLSTTYLLPAGGLQILRGVYRVGAGNGTACVPGTLNDHDDLVIAVGTEPDTAPPSVAITNPADGSTAGGVLAVNVDASDNFGVQRVELYDGDTLVATDFSAPYSLIWDSRAVPNGAHTLTARAYDAAGLVSTSAPVNVTVDNDHVPPQVSLTTPADGATVNGTIFIGANASDDRLVVYVDFYLDGYFLNRKVAAPYYVNWNTRNVSNGAHVLSATAYDGAGNASPQATVNVTVDNDFIPPQTAVTAPASGTTLSGTVFLEATATDDRQVTQVAFYVDNDYVGTAMTAPYAVSWDSTTVFNGSHTVKSVAFDGTFGTTSTPVTFSTNNVGVVRYDPTLKVPLCDTVLDHCDTLNAVKGRASMGPELNTPNTLDGCVDGTTSDQIVNVQRIRVVREDGTALAVGKEVRIDVDVYDDGQIWPYTWLSLYYTSDATHPSWTYLTTIQNTGPYAQTLSTRYVLRAGGLQAIRAALSFTGSSGLGPCVNYPGDGLFDRDDVAFVVGQEPDSVPPTVALTAPASGTTVTGTVTVTATASDNFGVVAVDFYDGDTLIGSATSAPYSVNWATRSGPNGSRTLTARARDLAGNITTSQSVTVTADNDLTPPVVTITAPAQGEKVLDPVIYASASDNQSVTRVEFYTESRLLCTATSAPYACGWSTNNETTGQHVLTAKAYDPSGNVGTSAQVTVNVSRDITPPSVSLTAPGATIAGSVTLSATATDASGVTQVDFLLDGSLLATDTSSPYSITWNTLTVADGSHTLTARATDAYGNVATSAGVSVTVDNTAPTVVITSPSGGATVGGMVPLQVNVTDSSAIARVDFFVDGALLASATTAPFSVVWDSGSWTNGSHTLTAWAYDIVNNKGASANVSVTTSQPGSAVFDSVLSVPKCATLNNACDTTTLVKGREAGEANSPNTLGRSCADGPVSYSKEKINRIKLSSVDGSLFAQGGRARITVYVDVIDPSTDALDLFYAADANHPSWTYLTTLLPSAAGAQVFSTEYALPVGFLQAVRAQFRQGGDSSSACSTGFLDDHDDVAFAVNSDPAVSITAPANNATVAGTVSLAATAAGASAVTKVEFYVDGTLIGTSTSAPYGLSWSTSAVAEGVHTLTAKAYDTGGRVGTSAPVVITLDNTPPTAALTSPTQGMFVQGNVALQATATDNQAVAKVEFYDGTTLIGTSTASPYTLNWSTWGVAEGAHTLSVKAYDNAGNVRVSSAVGVTVDNVGPAASITAPVSNARVAGTVQVSATAGDDVGLARVEFYVDGALIGTDTNAPYGVSWNSATVTDGNHVLTAKAVDNAGNVGTSGAVGVTTDNTPPTAALTAPAQGVVLRGSVSLAASASDNQAISKVEFYDGAALIGSASTVPYSLSWNTVAVADGAHTLTVKAYDTFGNAGTSAAVGVTVDNTAPTTALSAPAQGAQLRGTVQVSATASDNQAVARVELYADQTLLGTATTAPYALSWDTTTVANGSITLTANAYDTAGNVAQSAGRTVTVDNTAPTVAITSPANGATLFLSTTVQASASDNVSITQVVFYDGGTVIGTDTTAPYSVSWNLLTVSRGQHTLTAKAYDPAGNVTTSAPITVTVN